MLSRCTEIFPELAAYLTASYGSSSHLFFGPFKLKSACRIQQGDPLRPIIFSLAMRPAVSNRLCEFSVWYLDDAALGGSSQEVLSELDRILEICRPLHLELNENKCEVLTADKGFADSICLRMPNCRVEDFSHATLLGAPLSVTSATSTLDNQIAKLKSSRDRLSKIDRHDALTLLRTSFGHPRAVYVLRAGPAFDSPALTRYDEELRSCATDCLNVQLIGNRWTQATLSTELGGLGLRLPSAFACSAFLSAAASTSALVESLCNASPDLDAALALEQWTDQAGDASAPAGDATRRLTRWASYIEENTEQNSPN